MVTQRGEAVSAFGVADRPRALRALQGAVQGE